MKKIIAVTGIRSEFDILNPILASLQKSDFEIGIILSGAHLSDWHGGSATFIEKYGYRIVDRVDSLLMTNRETQRVKGIGLLLNGLAQTIEREQPDFLLVVGDREESIATALVGNYMNILTIHLAGGDPVYGNADDPIRHAVSKLAHIHLTLTQEHSRILEKMGEEQFRIFNIGNPSLDRIRLEPELKLSDISKALGVDLSDGNYIVLIKHPLSSEKNDVFEQMNITLEALDELGTETGLKTIGIFPNTDPGSYDILDAINKFQNSTHIRFYKTLERNIFINLVRKAKALVGNSSMAILEAPFFKLPVVNIGNRQKGRINCGNVEFVDHEKLAIQNSVKKACYDEKYRSFMKGISNIYGDGYSSQKVVDILKGIDPHEPRGLVKKLNYQGDNHVS